VTVVYVPLYGLQKKKYSTAYPKWFNPLLLEDQLAGEERIEVGLGLVAGNGGRRGPSTSAGLRPSSPVAVGMSVGVVRRTLLLAGTQDQWNGHRGVQLQLWWLHNGTGRRIQWCVHIAVWQSGRRGHGQRCVSSAGGARRGAGHRVGTG